MIENTQSNELSDRARLNQIADQQTTDHLPEETSWEEISAICETLHDQLEEVIATHVTETPLTQREAEVWVLTNFYDADYTRLTDEAIALAFAVPDSPFGADHGMESGRDRDGSQTAATVEECYGRAEDKYKAAKQFVGVTTFRERDEFLDNPNIAWLDRVTVQRIKDRSKAQYTTLDDILTRLLDDTETRRSLEELIRGYLESSGKDNVAQVALNRSSPESGTLSLTAHTGIQHEMPAVVRETDAIVIDDQQYDFRFDEDPYGPHEEFGRVILYAADDMIGMDAVQISDGIETARKRLQDAAERPNGDQL